MKEEKKKKVFPPYLRVVRDTESAPPSSPRPFDQLRQISKKSEVRRLVYMAALVAPALGTILFFDRYTDKLEREARPEKVYAVGDLNGDGINDLIAVQKDGYKIPLYCIWKQTDCISAETMRDNYGRDADYESIEDRLNKD